MESSFCYSSLQFPQQLAFIHHEDNYSQDYDEKLVPDDQMLFDQSESGIDDDHFQKRREEKHKITSPIRKTSLSRRVRKTKVKDSKPITRNWTDDEHKKFLAFYKEGKGGFSWNLSAGSKKRKGVFKEMSSFIGTRTPNQCKSHEQKFRSRLLQSSNCQTPFDLDFDSSPDSATLESERSPSNHEMDDHSSPDRIDASPISTALTNQSPGKDFHEVDKYFNLDFQASSSYFEEDKKNFIKISSFDDEIQEIENSTTSNTLQEKTWTSLIQGGSNHSLHLEIWSKMLDLVREVPTD